MDSNPTLSDHISAVSKPCLYHIRNLRRIRNIIDRTTACTIATSLVHSKLDYCNFLLLNLPAAQTNRLQLVLNSAGGSVTKKVCPIRSQTKSVNNDFITAWQPI